MTYQHLRDDVMVQLETKLGRLNVRYNQRDLLKDEIIKLQRRIARAVKSSAPSEQRKAERLSEILKSRMEAYTELLEEDIVRATKKDDPPASKEVIEGVLEVAAQKGVAVPEALTSLPLPEFTPPPVG